MIIGITAHGEDAAGESGEADGATAAIDGVIADSFVEMAYGDDCGVEPGGHRCQRLQGPTDQVVVVGLDPIPEIGHQRIDHDQASLQPCCCGFEPIDLGRQDE